MNAILSATQQLHLKSELEAFLQQIPFADIAAEVAAESERDAGQVLAMLETPTNECRAKLESECVNDI